MSSMSMEDFAFDTGHDDTASQDAMQGPASAVNQASARGAARGTPTRSLVMVWLAAVILYWLCAYTFRRRLS